MRINLNYENFIYLVSLHETGYTNILIAYRTDPASKKANPHCIRKTMQPITIKKNASTFPLAISNSVDIVMPLLPLEYCCPKNVQILIKEIVLLQLLLSKL